MGGKPRESVGVDAAMSAVGHSWHFARRHRLLSSPVIREVLARLAADARDASCEHRPLAIILSMLVDPSAADDVVAASWQRALQVMLDLNTTYGWGSRQRKAKLRGLAADTEVLAALAAVAVGCHDAPLDVLAVLAADGSDASIDALLPHFDRGENDDPRLTSLLRLRKHANPESPAIAALLDRLAARLEQRSEESPARALASSIGLGEPSLFWFRASIYSTELNPWNVSRYQGHVYVDSRQSTWFRVSLVEVEGLQSARSSFHSDGAHGDQLGLGRCEAAAIPDWFARAGAKLGVSWRVHLSSNMRGKKRAALSEWLVPGAS